jgi:hypothetical protein
LKGAPERVIEKCYTYKTQDGTSKTFTPDQKRKLIEEVTKIAK